MCSLSKNQNPYSQGRQFKIRFGLFILHQALYSRALAPASDTLVLVGVTDKGIPIILPMVHGKRICS